MAAREPEMVVFVGLQGAGKTSYYRRRFAATHAHVSKDRMSGRDKERRQRERLMRELSAGRSVVVDNTNPTPETRAPLVALARSLGARVVAYYFDIPLAECLARNRRRQGKARVPDVAILATAKRLVPPRLDEGFDEIHYVRPPPEQIERPSPQGAS